MIVEFYEKRSFCLFRKACEGIARNMFNGKATFNSAGTNAEIGSAPDYRSIAVCKKHGISISRHRARQFDDSDWYKFDLIVALDQDVLSTLKNWKPSDSMYNQIEKAMPDFLKEYNIIA